MEVSGQFNAVRIKYSMEKATEETISHTFSNYLKKHPRNSCTSELCYGS
jgi:hypothetical protein